MPTGWPATHLQNLQDRNETLFYHLLVEHFVDMCRIIYTPTVGWACLNYHRLYRRPRGMYFSAADKGEMVGLSNKCLARVHS